MRSSADNLDHLVRSSFLRGYQMHRLGRSFRPEGDAAVTKIEQAGWDAAEDGTDFYSALEEYLKGDDDDR